MKMGPKKKGISFCSHSFSSLQIKGMLIRYNTSTIRIKANASSQTWQHAASTDHVTGCKHSRLFWTTRCCSVAARSIDSWARLHSPLWEQVPAPKGKSGGETGVRSYYEKPASEGVNRSYRQEITLKGRMDHLFHKPSAVCVCQCIFIKVRLGKHGSHANNR